MPETSPLTVLHEPTLDIGGPELLAALRGALAYLQANQEEINDLNVFPVPDGDTGSNMYLTLRSAVEEAQAAADPASAAAVLAAAAHGSLMGARGNSGVILSQVLRGLNQGIAGAARLDAPGLANCLAEATRVAYKAVIKPTEGTILTVVRAAADAAREAAEHSIDLVAVLEAAVRASHAAVEATTAQLQVLQDAGVVDAGGFGLAVILEGLSRSISDPEAVADGSAPRRRSGESRVTIPSPRQAPAPIGPAGLRRGAAAVEMREDGWGYCTEFLVHGPGLDVTQLREELAQLGESALVVGAEDLVRVHIHTAEPAVLIAAAAQRGRLSKLKVEDMSAQHHDVLDRASAAEAATAAPSTSSGPAAVAAPRRALAVVSVAPGEGFRKILTSLGAEGIVEGGQTMNPSIEDLLTAVRAVNADSVVLLPNNGNVILTAQHVDALAEDCTVRVVPTRNLPQGVCALLALEPDASLEENTARMERAIEHVHAIEITRAVRDSVANGLVIREGDVLGILDDEIVRTGSDDAEVIAAVMRSVGDPPELATVYRGSDVDDAAAGEVVARLRADFPDVEFELHEGGQEHYSYVVSLE
ncbi:MAG: DAK2 domain-containing protein [Candidatus Dormibacteria bacterium]